jgi:short-subunit dehydrogenase involved in D-alanine esterification of teichoic acids
MPHAVSKSFHNHVVAAVNGFVLLQLTKTVQSVGMSWEWMRDKDGDQMEDKLKWEYKARSLLQNNAGIEYSGATTQMNELQSRTKWAANEVKVNKVMQQVSLKRL